MAQINKRTASNGKVTCHIRIRVQEYPERSKTLPTKTVGQCSGQLIPDTLLRFFRKLSFAVDRI